MAAARKAALIVLIILLAVCMLRANKPLTLTGKVYLPGPVKNQPYLIKGTLTISPEKIVISCEKNIFRLFNTYSDPLKNRISVSIKEVERIYVQGEQLLIFPIVVFYRKYRNFFEPRWEIKHVFFPDSITMEHQVLTFILDNPKAATVTGANLIKMINDRSKLLEKKHPGRGTGQVVER